jgi:hypothetical protein
MEDIKFKLTVITAIGSLDIYEKYIPRWLKPPENNIFWMQLST